LFITEKINPFSAGIKVEGILRQSADVEEVKRRLRDYEKGHFFRPNLFIFLFKTTIFDNLMQLIGL
jgi:hypothetical protein